MMIFSALALFACGVFFGAAVYISLVQHPAMMKAGGAVGSQFFPLMYHRAAPMQATLAFVGVLSAIIVWWESGHVSWLVGAIFLISVIVITLIVIKPVNNVLVSLDSNANAENTQQLLIKWGQLHWIRTLVSGIAFIIYLYAALFSQ